MSVKPGEDAHAIYAILNALMREDGRVTLRNEDGATVDCCAAWTNWFTYGFTGDTLLDALKNAYEAMTGHAFTTPERVASA